MEEVDYGDAPASEKFKMYNGLSYGQTQSGRQGNARHIAGVTMSHMT